MTEPVAPTDFPSTGMFTPPQAHMDATLECLRSLEPRDAVTASAIASYVGLSEWQAIVALMALKQRGLAVSRLRGGVQSPHGLTHYTRPTLWRAAETRPRSSDRKARDE